jgi:serine/threonine protein kinase
MKTARNQVFRRALTAAEAERSGVPYMDQDAWADTPVEDFAPVDDSGYQSIHVSQLTPNELKERTERYQIGDIIGGRYSVLDIHRGSMGVIYATYDKVEKMPRALKTLQQRFAHIKEMQQMFIEEASVWVRIEKHPFIVRAYLVDIFDGQPFVITEYIRGQEGVGNDLRAWLGKPDLTLEVSIELSLKVAQALQHDSRKVYGLVHRDLKPGNVLVDDRRRALVADIG